MRAALGERLYVINLGCGRAAHPALPAIVIPPCSDLLSRGDSGRTLLSGSPCRITRPRAPGIQGGIRGEQTGSERCALLRVPVGVATAVLSRLAGVRVPPPLLLRVDSRSVAGGAQVHGADAAIGRGARWAVIGLRELTRRLQRLAVRAPGLPSRDHRCERPADERGAMLCVAPVVALAHTLRVDPADAGVH